MFEMGMVIGAILLVILILYVANLYSDKDYRSAKQEYRKREEKEDKLLKKIRDFRDTIVEEKGDHGRK